MPAIGEQFRTWVLEQRPAGTTPAQVDGDHLRFDTDAAVAEVNLYPFADDTEIVEYRITRVRDDEAVFFLHFLLDDMARAQELFSQMAEDLAEEATRTTTRVLLCCTSALTTTMFAAKMGETAKALSLDYEFSAMSVERALAAGDEYAAILLAPQVAHLRQQMVDAHPNTVVFEIPGKVFGSYDAGAALHLVMQAFREMREPSGQEATLRAVRDLSDDRRVLIITLFVMRDYARLGFRLYDHGEPGVEGAVRKPRFDLRDVEDLIDTINLRGVDVRTLDAIGIAVPGVTYRGNVTLPDVMEGSYDLGRSLAKRLGIPVYVDNNCNAAAVGCYVSQSECESLVFYRHAFGHVGGGFGTVIDGRLLKGRANFAGEPKHFEELFALGQSYNEALWDAEGLHRLAADVALAAISLISPDAVYLAVDTVDDADEFRATLAEELGWDYVPPVHLVDDYVQRVYLGELALALQKLRDPKYRSLGVGEWRGIAPQG